MNRCSCVLNPLSLEFKFKLYPSLGRVIVSGRYNIPVCCVNRLVA